MRVEIRECEVKLSPDCTKTFQRRPQRGRPPIACEPCRDIKASPAIMVELEKICHCGNKFTIKPGRGRKAAKCEECRNAGTVYRIDDDGRVEAIQKAQIDREEQERKADAGRQRAELLTMDMQKLMRKRGLLP